jgi:hypothetical protein
MPKILYFLFLLIIPFKIWSEITHEVLRPTLTDFPRGKATVGAVLYILANKEIYILLGQESLDTGRKDAGTFSDLGGSTNPDQTFVDNVQRELYEESCGLINLPSEYLLKNGKVFYLNHKKNVHPSDAGRDIFYIAIPIDTPLSPACFRKKRLELLNQEKSDFHKAFLEKDRFEWINLDSLLKYTSYLEDGFMVTNLAGENIRIILRKFFWDDCLSQEDFRNYFMQIKQGIQG